MHTSPFNGHFDPTQLIPGLILLVLYLLLVIYCLEDLLKSDRHVTGGNKGVWAIIIIFSGVGAFIYLMFGREK